VQEQFCEQNNLEEIFKERLRGGMRPTAEIDVNGIVLGAGTYLVRFTRGLFGKDYSGRKHDDERMLALLSVACGQHVSTQLIKSIAAASNEWRYGDKTLAQIRLSQAGLPCLTGVEDAYRLFLAETLLDNGMKPRALMTALGFDPSEDLAKYDPNQPRVAAGNGRESGRWGSGGGGSSQAFLGPAAGPTRTLLTGATPSASRALAAFASRFSIPTAVFGALFIPTANSGGVTEGTLLNAPGVRFKQDNPAGTLTLTATAANGSSVIVSAQNRGGIYVDVRTGRPLGSPLGEQLYLDMGAVREALHAGLVPGQELAPGTYPKPDENEPKLCPEPERDTPHGSSERAKDYEDDVHARVNPLAPIPRGYGVNLTDPLKGNQVFFEDCFRYAGDLVDGDMRIGDLAEAKGQGYEWRIRAGGQMRNDASKNFAFRQQNS